MSEEKIKEGTEVKGKSSRAISQKNAKKNTYGSVETVKSLDSDFVLLQEVDVEATRSYGINQRQVFETKLSNYASIFALNFHAPYMIYPFTEPHGSVQSGLLTLSRYKVNSATRISYPVDSSFLSKFFDLDRCFTITRLPVSNGKELVIINNHMSAYDEGGTMRAEQLKLLNQTMEKEIGRASCRERV